MLNKEAKDEIETDIKKYSALEALTNSNGGKVLIKNTVAQIESVIDKLSVNYKTLPEMELRSLCAEMDTKINLWRTLTRASKQKKFALQALEESDSES